MSDRELYSGTIRLHTLHHAAREPIFGLGIIAALRRHGYGLSPGTVYPALHGMERAGYLKSSEKLLGRRALKAAKVKVRELFGELFEGGVR